MSLSPRSVFLFSLQKKKKKTVLQQCEYRTATAKRWESGKGKEKNYTSSLCTQLFWNPPPIPGKKKKMGLRNTNMHIMPFSLKDLDHACFYFKIFFDRWGGGWLCSFLPLRNWASTTPTLVCVRVCVCTRERWKSVMEMHCDSLGGGGGGHSV